MPISRLTQTLLSLVFLAALPPVFADESSPQSHAFSVSFIDGDQIALRIKDNLEITTPYGELKVPAREIRRIVPGIRYSDEIEQQIGRIVSQLLSSDAKTRSVAEIELLSLKKQAYPAVIRATESQNAELHERAKTLVAQLQTTHPELASTSPDFDIVYTDQFHIIGRIKQSVFRGESNIVGTVDCALRDIQELVASDAAADVVPERNDRNLQILGHFEDSITDGNSYLLSLSDRSILLVEPVFEQLRMATSYGELIIPTTEIRQLNLFSESKPAMVLTNRFPIRGRPLDNRFEVKSAILGNLKIDLVTIRALKSLSRSSAELGRQPATRTVEHNQLNQKSGDIGFDVRLSDGSEMNAECRDENLTIKTSDGDKTLAFVDILRVDFGVSPTEDEKKEIAGEIARLADGDDESSNAAISKLSKMGDVPYLQLKQAFPNSNDETRSKVEQLINTIERKHIREPAVLQGHDVIATATGSLTGKIKDLTLNFHNKHIGSVKLSSVSISSILCNAARSARIKSLLVKVGEAVHAGKIAKTEKLGTGKDEYEDYLRRSSILTGFEVTHGRFGNSPTVTTFRPIFMTRTGRAMGTTHGVSGDNLIRVEAKPGFAVGAVTIKAGLGVDGMSVTFMEITDQGLDPNRAYESEWLGGFGGGPKQTIGGTGAPIIGIFGASASGTSTFNGLGLVSAMITDIQP